MEFYIPDNKSIEEAFKNTTHLCIAAHQDDTELMAYHGILTCYGKKGLGFSTVILTNGSGSPRSRKYALYSDEQMQEARKKEQIRAALIGKYAFLGMMDCSSSIIKRIDDSVVEEIHKLLKAIKPKVLYTHNPFDRHDTHVATLISVIKAVNLLEDIDKPALFIGCEVWRSLDWLSNEDKLILEIDDVDLLKDLLKEYDSQISGGKAYDEAIIGRLISNATFYQDHNVDKVKYISYGMKMNDLIYRKKELDDFCKEKIAKFNDNVLRKVKKKGDVRK